jgi:hypothetical protein
MLRSLGIPARVAAGFAQGTADEAGRQFLVRQRDAHAWPEVFFPGFGWVEFEPTSAQPPLQRLEVAVPSDETPGSASTDVPELADELRDLRRLLGGKIDDALEAGPEIPVTRPSPVPWLAASGLLLAAGLVWLRLDPVARFGAAGAISRSLTRMGVKPPPRLARYDQAPLTPVAKVYWRWSQGLGRLGIPIAFNQTPFERARSFARQYPLEAERGWTIAQAYAAERFGNRADDPEPVLEAWRALGPWMVMLWLEKVPAQARKRLAESLQPASDPGA